MNKLCIQGTTTIKEIVIKRRKGDGFKGFTKMQSNAAPFNWNMNSLIAWKKTIFHRSLDRCSTYPKSIVFLGKRCFRRVHKYLLRCTAAPGTRNLLVRFDTFA